MAILFVQNKGNYGTGDAWVDVTLDSSVVAGNILLVALIAREQAAFTSGMVTKQAGTATIGTPVIDRQRVDFDVFGDSQYEHVALASIEITGSGTLTLRFSGTSLERVMGVGEFSGADLSGARLEDSDDAFSATGWTPEVPSMSSAGEAVFVSLAYPDVHSPGTDFAAIYDQGNTSFYECFFQYDIVSGATSKVSPFGDATSVGGAAIGAVYKTAVAAERKWLLARP